MQIHSVEIEDELHRACALVADGMGGGDGGNPQCVAQLVRQAGGGGFLDHLLVAALQRAIAFEQVDGIAMAVGKQLHFYVARALDQLLQHHAGIAEGSFALALGGHQGFLEFVCRMDGAHTLAATAGHRLDQQRETDTFGGLLQPHQALVRALIARRDRHAGFLHRGLGGVLQRHHAHGAFRRADEDDPDLFQRLGEIGILGKKAIAGVNGIGAGALGRCDDGIHVEIGAVPRQRHSLAGFAHERRVRVGSRMDGNRGNAHPVRCADDAAGDFPAIGDQDFLHVSHFGGQPFGSAVQPNVVSSHLPSILLQPKLSTPQWMRLPSISSV